MHPGRELLRASALGDEGSKIDVQSGQRDAMLLAQCLKLLHAGTIDQAHADDDAVHLPTLDEPCQRRVWAEHGVAVEP